MYSVLLLSYDVVTILIVINYHLLLLINCCYIVIVHASYVTVRNVPDFRSIISQSFTVMFRMLSNVLFITVLFLH